MHYGIFSIDNGAFPNNDESRDESMMIHKVELTWNITIVSTSFLQIRVISSIVADSRAVWIGVLWGGRLSPLPARIDLEPLDARYGWKRWLVCLSWRSWWIGYSELTEVW